MQEIPTDMFGNPLIKGDLISYPGRSGSNLYVNLGIFLRVKDNIQKIQIVKINNDISEKEGRKTSLNVLERVIKLPFVYLNQYHHFSDLEIIKSKLISIRNSVMSGNYN